MVKIIAEVGANHGGNINLAKEMIAAAAQSGANYVKFQSWKEENLSPGPWDKDEPFFHYKNKRDFYKTVELLDEQHYELREYCEKQKIKLLTTCFDRTRVGFLSKLGLDCIKVASCDSTSKLMIQDLSRNFNKIIASTGATTNEEIINLAKQLHELGVNFVLMHCISIYPTPVDKVSLRRMDFIKKLATEAAAPPRGEFGISDHTLGVNVSIAAITRGATWIEKHFTIDNDLPGPDNKMSITPHELKTIRNFCDDFEIMSNNKDIDIQEQETELRKVIIGRFGDNS
tara:strand:- start:3758 stop:4615 length:858 start_codon:yes stop_codon:yes gene_type:complete